MKKVIVNFGLMLLAMLLLPACSSNSEEEEYQMQEYQMQNGAFEGVVYEEGGTPVSSSPLSVFLTKELHPPYWDGYGNMYMTFFYPDTAYPYQDTCLVINSREEFQAAYHGKEQLPDVDFKNNTLVICQTSAPDGVYRLGRVMLQEQPDNYELQMSIFDTHSELSLCTAIHIYYWRLFPKLKDKEIILKPTVKH